jgi:HEPN domain-containing protein
VTWWPQRPDGDLPNLMGSEQAARDLTRYRTFAETVERDFAEAHELVEQGHNEMALFRAVASFEWFMKRAFLEPYVELVALGLNGELAKLIMQTVRRPNGWRREIPSLLKAFWQIDIDEVPAWKDFLDAWSLRNEIAHDSGRCDRRQAEQAIYACEVALKALLINRIDANADVKAFTRQL